MVKIVSTIADIKAQIKEWQQAGFKIGLVPTMGYLHEGHKSLMEKARLDNDRIIVSIFVNPIQFGPNEDLTTYPRDIKRDQQICSQANVDLIFHPQANEMYGTTFATFVDMTGLTETLCGSKRPGHFRGVCTVVNKLFNIIEPHNAYFGQKDAQQLAIIKKMVNDLNINVQVIGCPIVRDADGLAKSSRNSYLNPVERKAALCLYKAIKYGQQCLEHGERNSKKIELAMQQIICQEPLASIDYITIVDAETLQPVEEINKLIVCALAVYIGKTRLIDNFTFKG